MSALNRKKLKNQLVLFLQWSSTALITRGSKVQLHKVTAKPVRQTPLSCIKAFGVN